jgi:demethylmenaquinone methyltransferase/2-methoxy-6-polyprenyl-1,4-benzoquinol methylase
MEKLYRKIASKYDLLAHLYYLVGFRGRAYREMAVRELNLNRGDTVIDIGCGTGLCFPYLQKRVGPEGKIIGVDLSGDMLDRARKRVQKNGWSNVELVKRDAAEFVFPEGVSGIISVFVMRSIEEYDAVTRRGAKALSPGGRFVILDLKLPENSPDWLNRLFVQFAKPFGVTMELAERRLWEPAEKCLVNTRLAEIYLGFAYIFSGESPLLPSQAKEW